ncbi:MAG TPA: DNA glycosylase [Cytophagales bacterium]|nr:DNA glycosylase [Cytophagales bacterium]
MQNTSIQIHTSPCFSFDECLWFLDRRYDDCSHKVIGHSVWKALHIEGNDFLLQIQGKEGGIRAEIIKGVPTKSQMQQLTAYLSAWFDVDRDMAPFYKLLSADLQLSYMTRDFYGLRLVGIVELFEALCWSIIGQQINLTFAYALKRRIVERYGTKLIHEGLVYTMFPSPEALTHATVEELRSMQFSIQKASYLIGIAQDFMNGVLSKEMLMSMPDMESRQKVLLSRHGIGVWTANYTLMKCLHDRSAIPYGDAGMLNAMLRHGIITDKKDYSQIHAFFERYKDWESYIVFYLWRSNVQKPSP